MLWRATPLRHQARWIAGLAALQLATGLANVVLDWPIAAAVLHTGGASALVIVLTWALCESRAHRTAAARATSRGLSA
jgi:cytochrome c oxidase assembly protein subunit 15